MAVHFSQLTGAENRWESTIDASMLYYGLLDRAPDGSGLSFWTGQLNGGMAYTEAIRLFRTGTEYRGRIGVGTGC